MLDFELPRFTRSLFETVAWFDRQSLHDLCGPMKDKLRSPALKPSFSLDQFGNVELWAEAVAEVVAKRSQLIGRISQQRLEISNSGRLLLYYPQEQLADGAAEYSSNGFFDVNNVPPWDIWVDFSEHILVSWVPPGFIEAAQIGIDVNPEQCIRWAD
jgi:hypothetical protein